MVTIGELARASGVTTRTLRHYDALGLLPSTFQDHAGVRHYDDAACVRLQRILILRSLGLSLTRIGQVLAGTATDAAALEAHMVELRSERDRLTTQIATVEHTVAALRKGHPMPEDMFAGFNHSQYHAEVAQRWGKDAWAQSSAWWKELDTAGREAFLAEQRAIQDGFDALIAAEAAASDPAAQELAARQCRWVRSAWGGRDVSRDAFIGLGEMYVADERFAANYNRVSPHGPRFVADAMRLWAQAHL